MGKFRKLIVFILLVTFMSTTIPLKVFAQGINTQTNSTQIGQTETKDENQETKKILEEVIEKREDNIKHFLLEDKTYEAVIYNQPVHYKENGQWKDIDNTLVENTDEELLKEDYQENNEENEVVKSIEEKTEDKNESTVEKENKNEDTVVDNNEKQKENTKKEDIPIKKSKEKNVLQNTSNGFKINFAKNANSKKLIRINKDKYEISWGLQNAKLVSSEVVKVDEKKLNSLIEKNATDQVNNSDSLKDKSEEEKNKEKEIIIENEKKKTLNKIASSIIYDNILPDIDLSYSLISDKVKENLIINNKVENNVFTYNIEVKNLIAKKQENNTIIFYDKDDNSKIVFIIDVPYMFDSNGAESNDIKLELSESKKGYTFKIEPSQEWLNDKERVYPITIDPDIKTDLSAISITDTFTASNDTANKYNNQYLRVGYNSTIGTTRSFLKFTLPTLTSAETVIAAQLNIVLNSASVSNQIDVHKITSDWISDASHAVTWNNMPGYNLKVEDYEFVNGSDKWVSWDITAIAKEWYSSGNNYGLMLKSNNESTTNSIFYSSDDDDATIGGYRPQVIFHYTNNSGLEDYWTYHSQDVGRAGIGYVNDYNGNLVFMHNDLSMNGNRMPINISHVYNSNQKESLGSTYTYGTGWRLNLSQRITSKTIDGVNYYEYIDGDGTKHYLKWDSTSSVWKDESGLDITMTINSSSSTNYYTLKDKSDNKLTFTSAGYLYEIIDNNNNKLTLTYSGMVLKSVKDGAGRVTTLDVDASGYLKGIIDPSGRRTSYEYTGSNLTKITYPDGKYATFSYDSNINLTQAVNIDGYKMSYQYYTVKPYRIKTIQEIYNDGTYGQKLDLTYGYNLTSFKDANGRKNIYQFNDQGNTISERDTDGSATYSQYGTTTNKNKLLLNSKMQKSTMNLLPNHNAEVNSNWYLSPFGGSEGSFSYDIANKYFGNQSLKVVKTNNIDKQHVQQYIKIEKGKTYTLSGYMKTEGISNNNGKGASIYVTYQDGAKNWLYAQGEYISSTNDWKRYEVTFTVPSDSVLDQAIIRCGIVEETGTAYFDALQVEEGQIANRYNLVENPNFVLNNASTFQFWSASNADAGDGLVTSTDVNYPTNLDKMKTTYKLSGVATKNKNIYQTIKVSGKKGDVLVAAGWAKGNSVPISGTRYFALDIGFKLTDGTTQYCVIPFNEDSLEWQYTSAKVIADSDFNEVIFYGLYYLNSNSAEFDGFQLYKEEFGQSYQYDSKGNIISTKDLAQKNSQFEYNTNNDLVKSVDVKGNSFKYEYDNNHNITKATTAENVVYSFEYDSYGNPKKSKITGTSLFISSDATYTDNGNYIDKLTDSSGNTVDFNYNETKGTLDNVSDANGKITSYAYDSNTDALKSVSKSVNGVNTTNSYGYENDRIKTITHNGFNYTFNYDKMGNNSQVLVGSQSLISNNYEVVTGRLKESTYGNGYKIAYDYDILDRVTGKKFNGSTSPSFSYEYDASGNLGTLYDAINNVNYRYIYDVSDRLMKVSDNKGNETSFTYDSNNNNSSINEKLNNFNYTTNYRYDKDNRLTSIYYNRNAASNSLKEKLVANLDFENGDVTDNSGNGYDGKIYGNPTFVDSPRGKGIKLDGVDDWIQLPDFDVESSFSISMFLKPELKSNNTFLSKVGTDGINQFWSGIWSELYTAQINSSVYKEVTPTLDDQHIVITFQKKSNTTTEVKFYKNNTLIWTSILNSVFNYAPGKGWDIGQDWDGTTTSDFFKGVIDEFSIYKGVLTPAEIGSIYKNTENYIDKSYDDLGRLINSKINNTYSTKYNYQDGKGNGTATSKISSIVNGNNQVKYTYDANGNIETINEGKNTTRYYYDELNELVKEVSTTDNKLLAYYNFDDSKATDSSIYARDGSMFGSPKIVPGKSGNGVEFDGIDDYIELKDFALPDEFTISMWVNPYTTKDGQCFLGKHLDNGANMFLVGFWSGYLATQIRDGVGYYPKNTVGFKHYSFVVKKISSTQSDVTLYIDGNNQGTKTITGVMGNTFGKPWVLGQEWDGETVKSDFFNGVIDEVAFYDGALNASEVSSVYSSGVAVPSKKAVTYSYDLGGNITKKSQFNSGYTSGAPVSSISYSYGDTNWKDKLTSYNGKTITYDAIGNPLNDSVYTYTWEMGRQLKTITGNSKTLEFKYNDSGIRTEKKVGSVVTSYHLVGDKVTYEETVEGSTVTTVYYTYDANGKLVSMNLNGTEYFYIRNAQSDIIGLIDKTGTQVVSYTYDSWGKLISIDGSLKDTVGVKNPYRYRGYRYDTETGVYYLQSRYYNPEWGRFINADEYGGNIGELLSHNIFAYCSNNPVNRFDPDGRAWWAIGAAIGAVAGAVVGGIASDWDWRYMLAGAAAGALVGAGLGYAAEAAYVAIAGAGGAIASSGTAVSSPQTTQKASKAVETTLDLLKGVEKVKGQYYAGKATMDKVGIAEARGVDFSKLTRSVVSSRPANFNGTIEGVSRVLKYSDSKGTRFIIHEVINGAGNVVHRDFDAVRIFSGQLINKR